MKLNPAKRISGSRCAEPAATVVRLEQALGAASGFAYVEHKVSDHLYWGSLHLDALAFPPLGKGVTPELCKASTLAEGAEWLAIRRLRSLAGYRRGLQQTMPNPLAVSELLRHIDGITPALLGQLLETERARHWVDGFSLVTGKTLNVPLEYGYGIGGTNGLAAGNCREEAIVQGINEVFERRAVITVIKNRMVVPTIDPTSIEDAVIQAQLAALTERGVVVTIKDLSFGDALPCVGVYFELPDVPETFQRHHVFKAGSSFDRVSALQGCFTEFAQLAETGESYERLLADDASDTFLPLFWFGYVPYVEAGFLKEGEPRAFDPGVRFEDCLEDIERARALCGQLDLDFIAVDLTDPKVGFPVIQVIVPGYSDILPYHSAGSPVLFTGWTRDLPMGYVEDADGAVEPCTAQGFFPDW